jgi:translation initiation factor 3 subunit L
MEFEFEADEIDIPAVKFDDFDQDNVQDAVKSFLVNFQLSINEGNVFDLQNLYENKFNQLTDKLYQKQRWPQVDTLKMLQGDTLVQVLYAEMYYRHIYAKLQPTSEERIQSYHNYIKLFDLLHANPTLELPNQWIWDIVDEFIYQFQSWCQVNRKLKSKENVWNIHTVIQTLHKLARVKEDTPLFKMLSYFSLIGLLRIQCLLGDYTLALKEIEQVELHKKGLYARVMACHVTTFYYVGFAYSTYSLPCRYRFLCCNHI